MLLVMRLFKFSAIVICQGKVSYQVWGPRGWREYIDLEFEFWTNIANTRVTDCVIFSAW